MNHIQINSELIEQLIDISIEAGDAILGFYNSEIDIQVKSDSSPLTKADIESNSIIVKRLKTLIHNIPILSEEEADIPFDIRSKWNEYWLIDPLDGTKEFIKRNGEFTVNIALIENESPIMGVVYAPVLNNTWYGSKDTGSYVLKDGKSQKIKVNNLDQTIIKVVSSRSHANNPKLEEYLKQFSDYELIKMGSSIKICLVADGSAHMYPRLGPTMEWDTAAAHAVVKYAGGNIWVEGLTINGKVETRFNSQVSFWNSKITGHVKTHYNSNIWVNYTNIDVSSSGECFDVENSSSLKADNMTLTGCANVRFSSSLSKIKPSIKVPTFSVE